MGGRSLLAESLARRLSLDTLVVGSPGPGEELPVRIPQELTIHGIQEPLESPQAPRPLHGSTLET